MERRDGRQEEGMDGLTLQIRFMLFHSDYPLAVAVAGFRIP